MWQSSLKALADLGDKAWCQSQYLEVPEEGNVTGKEYIANYASLQ